MRCTPGARLALLIALVCAAAPAARAGGPLGPGAPCKDLQDVIDSMAFETGFAVDKGCDKLYKKAGATCAKNVNRAVTCQRKNIDDSAFFQIQVTCEGEKGSALKTCAKPIQDQQKSDREALESERGDRLDDCKSKAQTC